jgi:hypothetical protein
MQCPILRRRTLVNYSVRRCGLRIGSNVFVARLLGFLRSQLPEVIVGMGLKKLPLLPSRQTIHLMAKAAVTVYETAVENQHRDN